MESEAVNQFYLARHCTNSLHEVTGIYSSKHRCVYFIHHHALSFSELSIRKLWSHCLCQTKEPSAESTSMARILFAKMRCERLCFAQKNVSILLEGATPNKIKTLLAALGPYVTQHAFCFASYSRPWVSLELLKYRNTKINMDSIERAWQFMSSVIKK